MTSSPLEQVDEFDIAIIGVSCRLPDAASPAE